MVATYSAEEIIELTGARMASGMLPDEVGEVATDTRIDLAGSWFVALIGKTFDGHDFIGDAFSAGALGCIVADRPSYPIAATSFPLLAVPDTEEALGKLTRNWRRRTRKKLVLVAATNFTDISNLAVTVYGELERALILHTGEVPSSGDFSAPALSVREVGMQLSTQFSLDPAIAFPTTQSFECTEAAQSFLANWKISVSEILSRFLNLPDEVEYVVADFSPLPLDRARFVIDCLAPNALILAQDSYDYERLAQSSSELTALKLAMVEAVQLVGGQVYSTSRELAKQLGLTFINFPADECQEQNTRVQSFDIQPDGSFTQIFKQLGL